MLNIVKSLFAKLVDEKGWIFIDRFSIANKLNDTCRKEIDLTFLAIVHGNEPIGLEVFSQLLEKLYNDKMSTGSAICFSLGNVEAYKRNSRYIDTDLNRNFGTDVECAEKKTSLRLESVLSNTRYMLDLHQTQKNCEKPYFISTFNQRHIDFCHQVIENAPIVTYLEKNMSFGMDSDEFVNSHRGVGVTLELGQIGNENNFIELGVNACVNAIKYIDGSHRKIIPEPTKILYKIAEKMKISKDKQLVKSLGNLTKIGKSELLAIGFNSIFADKELYTLCPKYKEELNTSQENESVMILEKTKLSEIREKILTDSLKKRQLTFRDESLTEIEKFGLGVNPYTLLA